MSSNDLDPTCFPMELQCKFSFEMSAGESDEVDSVTVLRDISLTKDSDRVGHLPPSLDMTSSFSNWLSSNKPKSGLVDVVAPTSHLLDDSSLFLSKDYMDLEALLPFDDNETRPRLLSHDDINTGGVDLHRPRAHSECWLTDRPRGTNPSKAPEIRSRAYTADPTVSRLRRRFSRSYELTAREAESHILPDGPVLRPTDSSNECSLVAARSSQYNSGDDLDDNGSIEPSQTERTPITIASNSNHQLYSDTPLSEEGREHVQLSPLVSANEDGLELERSARVRWIRINRQFQMVITLVALIFSLLLLAILTCWVVLTVSYALSWNQDCDVPLKPYYWLVTLQLILDVFRSDIMRFLFRWDNQSSERIPGRVVAYNCIYLLYALLVLRLGVNSVLFPSESSMCHETAPRLFHTSLAFVSLSIAAWATIICGYIIPFLIVAILLTMNGYNPYTTSHNTGNYGSSTGTSFPVIPNAFATTGAPPGCVDQLRILSMDDVPISECCICMELFAAPDVVVETNCNHLFHKSCCREWLRHSRTCPVCRDDIPSTLEPPKRRRPESSHGSHRGQSSIPIGPSDRPLENLRHVWLATRNSWHDRANNSSHSYAPDEEGEGSIPLEDNSTDLEVGQSSRSTSTERH